MVRSRVLLGDGRPAVVSRLGPADLEDLVTLHDELGEQDRSLRFDSMHPAHLRASLARTVGGEAGAIGLGARVRGDLVGAVLLLQQAQAAGDVALVVASSWQERGVATVLLEELAAVALRAGVVRLVADVPAENVGMIGLLSDLGLPVGVSRAGSVLRVEVELHGDERYAASVERRHRLAAAASLRPVLQPETVAVIGAGRGAHSLGRVVLRSLQTADFDGALFAVNPEAGHLEGVPCWPSVLDLPGAVDLAVVTVPPDSVAEVVEQCGRHGVRAVLLITDGLARIDGLPARVRALVERYGMRLIGPNTAGVVGPGDGSRLDTTITAEQPPAGTIGLIAQSGGVAIATVTAWRRMGLGLSAMVALGDALDVGARDVMAWLAEDRQTSIVVLYAESEPGLRGLVQTSAHLAARVPVLALEPGRTAAGSRAAASHTARAATPAVFREAAYAAGGIQSVADLPGMAATIGLLSGQPLPSGETVVVLTNVGGGGVLAADACAAAGLAVDPLPEALQERLRAVLPPQAVTGNPVDAGAGVTEDGFAAALAVLLASPAVGAVLTVTAPTAVTDPGRGVRTAAAEAARQHARTPIVDVQIARATTVERIDLPDAPPGRFLVSVNDPGCAARALGVAMRRREWLARDRTAPVLPDGVDLVTARRVVRAVLDRAPCGDWLLPDEVAVLAGAGGLPVLAGEWVTSAAAAAAAVTAGRGPMAVKGFVRGVTHKGDAGLIRLPITAPEQAAQMFEEWSVRAQGSWLGALVQPVLPPGDELLVGAIRDPSTGPVVALGPGGRAADALGHRVHRLAPLCPADVEEMLLATELFDTGRGRRLDTTGVADCVLRVGWLADALPEIAEFEVNPLVLTEAGCHALDVRVRVVPAGC